MSENSSGGDDIPGGRLNAAEPRKDLKMNYDNQRFPGFDVVAYHSNCTDGLAAAAVVCNALDPTCCGKFVPVQYGQPLPEEVLKGGENILFLDWCPEPEQIAEIQAAWKDWFVIDHHKSREWIADLYPSHAVFANDKCGAVLTYEWLHPGSPLPEMLGYIQDRDLWQWRLKDSREISAGLNEEIRTVERFTMLLGLDPSCFYDSGRVLLTSRTRAARSLATKAFMLQTPRGISFRAVNATENLSEVAEEILACYSDVDIACAFFQVGRDKMQLSFRSRAHAPGQCVALDAAQELGGGGHEHAAGARIDLIGWAGGHCVASLRVASDRIAAPERGETADTRHWPLRSWSAHKVL